MKVVIVGNGMVGFRLCERLATSPRLRVTVFGDEPSPAYDRVRLTEGLLDGHPERLELAPRAWYARHGIELFTGDPIVAIDRAARTVRAASGRSAGYDALVLATGSMPRRPPIPGAGTDGVLVYRSLEDARRIGERARCARRAVVLGGGLLGIEAAGALRALGLEVAVVEAAGHLLPRQLGAAAAAALGERIAALGITTVLGERAAVIDRRGDGLAVTLGGGASLDAELVILALGIRASDALGAACGLTVAAAPHGGVVVDDALRTSDPRIHAIGECASHRGITHGLVAPGLAMADVLADRLRGGSARFRGAAPRTVLKLAGVEVAVLGDVGGDGERITHRGGGDHRTLVIRRGRVVGAELVGAWTQRARAEAAIGARERLGRDARARFVATGDAWDPAAAPPRLADAAVVCGCLVVRAGALARARAAGATTVLALAATTGAGTRCGTCRPLLASLCGEPPPPRRRAATWALAALSLVALAGCLAFVWPGGVDTSRSVESAWFRVGRVWRDELAKHVTGYAVVGLGALGLLLSLRRRTPWLRGSFGGYRVLHAACAVGALGFALAHTGLHAGHNVNRLLMITFLVVQLTGAAVGGLAALESSTRLAGAQAARRSRPLVTRAHLAALWALPTLLVFHLLAVYRY